MTPRTRAILVNTPSNPSGKVLSQDEIAMVARIAVERDLFVLTDEIYEYFVYDGHRHLAPAAFREIADRTISISGVSKTFCVTGWRIGYSVTDPLWTQTIGYFSDLVYVCAPAPLQVGIAKGLMELEDSYFDTLSSTYQKKRDLLCSALVAAGFTPYLPQGAYYVLADISRLPGSNSRERAMYLLEKSGVACVPGEAFYHDNAGDGLGRFCFSKRDEILEEACARLRRADF